MHKILEQFGALILNAMEGTGRVLYFLLDTIGVTLRYGIRWDQVFEQALQIGVRSSLVIILTSLFTGLVFAFEVGYAFGLFGAKALIGPSVVLSLTRQLSPVLAALMVTGRAGSAMAAELGTMRVSEQIDALHAMAVPPLAYLVVPRILATTLMLPLLTIIFDFVGFVGAYLVSINILGISSTTFIDQILTNVKLKDIYSGLYMATVFGFLIATICTSRGYFASGGAKGVGRATTQAVVVSSASILVADYLMVTLIF